MMLCVATLSFLQCDHKVRNCVDSEAVVTNYASKMSCSFVRMGFEANDQGQALLASPLNYYVEEADSQIVD